MSLCKHKCDNNVIWNMVLPVYIFDNAITTAVLIFVT
jgi:hypothetical protein